MNKYEQLKNLIESDEAEKYITENMESTIENLKRIGIEFTMEELQDMIMAYKASLTDNGEVSIDDLDTVSGGLTIPNPFKGIRPLDLFRKGDRNWFNKYLNNLEKITRGGY